MKGCSSGLHCLLSFLSCLLASCTIALCTPVEIAILYVMQDERRRGKREISQLEGQLRASHAAIRALEKQVCP